MAADHHGHDLILPPPRHVSTIEVWQAIVSSFTVMGMTSRDSDLMDCVDPARWKHIFELSEEGVFFYVYNLCTKYTSTIVMYHCRTDNLDEPGCTTMNGQQSKRDPDHDPRDPSHGMSRP